MRRDQAPCTERVRLRRLDPIDSVSPGTNIRGDRAEAKARVGRELRDEFGLG